MMVCRLLSNDIAGVEDSPFMTWGEIEGTPFRLDASDMPITGGDSAPAFKVCMMRFFEFIISTHF